MDTKKLYRSRTDKIIFGVAGGLAKYFVIDPIIVRLIFLLFTFGAGSGILIYIILAIIMPEEPLNKESSHKTTSAENSNPTKIEKQTSIRTEQTFGIILLLVGSVLFLNNFVTWLSWDKFWPLILITVGIIILINQRKEIK